MVDFYGKCTMLMMLMVQKSGDHQLIWRRWCRFSSINSRMAPLSGERQHVVAAATPCTQGTATGGSPVFVHEVSLV